MIKLQRPEKPKQLTDKKVEELTEEYKKTATSVWNKDYIKKPLLKMSFAKCCFCETNVNEESKYMEVEHFHPKSIYPDEVVDWNNLLPICKRCNGKGAKADHDTKLEPIINPTLDNPKAHLQLNCYRLYGITPLGKKTINVVALNNKQRLVDVRFEIGDKLIEQLGRLLKNTQGYLNNQTIENRNDIIEHLHNIMIEGTKEREYSATAATVILKDPNYQEIRQLFSNNHLWTNDFIELEQEMQYCALI